MAAAYSNNERTVKDVRKLLADSGWPIPIRRHRLHTVYRFSRCHPLHGSPHAAVLNHVAKRADTPEGCNLTPLEMAAACGTSERTVKDTLKALCEVGWLIPVRRRRLHSLYRLPVMLIQARDT